MIIKYMAVGAAFVASLLVLAGCAGNVQEPTPQEPTPATAAPAATLTPAPTAAPPGPANPAPADDRPVSPPQAADFRFVLFQGEEILGASEMALSELEGMPLVLNFWARFCTPCWSEMPELQEFYEEYEDQVQLVGIDVGQFTGLGSPKNAGKLLEALGITYPAGYTDDASVVQEYQIRAMPTTVFISPEGHVLRVWSGSINREQLEEIVLAIFKGE